MKRLEEAYLEDLGLVITKNKRSGLYGIETEDGEVILPQKYDYIDDVISRNGILMAKDEDGDKVKIDIYSYMPEYMYENKRMREEEEVLSNYYSYNDTNNPFITGFYTSGDKYYLEVFYNNKFKSYDIKENNSSRGAEDIIDLYAKIVNSVYTSDAIDGIKYKKQTGDIIKNAKVAIYVSKDKPKALPLIYAVNDPIVKQYENKYGITFDIISMDLTYSDIIKTIENYITTKLNEKVQMTEKSYIVIDNKKEVEVPEEFLDDMNDYIDSVPKLSWSFSGEEYKGNTYIYTDKNSIQTVVNGLQKKRVKIPNTLKSFLEKNIVYSKKENTMKRRHFREGPGSGYTYKLSGFYGDFETTVKRLYTYRYQILADIVQTSKKFEFDAEWSGYDWSGEDSDIKGDYIEFESTIEVLNYTDEATELLIEYLQDIGLEEEVDRFFIKKKIDPNELDLDDLLSFFDVNNYIFSDRKYDFNKFIENNSRNMSLNDLQLIAYEEVYGTGYSHVEFSDTIFIDKNDLNKNADFEYTVNDGISLLIKSKRLSDLINESYEDSQYNDDYDD